jgi:hypothetical protein
MIETFKVLTSEECDTIIKHFNNDDLRIPGHVAGNEVKSDQKVSTDIACELGNPLHLVYNAILLPAMVTLMDQYVDKYPILEEGYQFNISPTYNLQHYKDGEGYSAAHMEYAPMPNTTYPYRMLAWIFYLNNAECGTEFILQDTILEAKAGVGAVWPAYWTHTHRGVCPNIGDKYIATGWCLYTPFSVP